ncbi:MAG: 23S rRNA (uracil(1939)-C(5))-methyltransferase RlmD [Lachnospiraceae bacterium]
MDLKKNELFTVDIVDISDTGEGIGKMDGFTWFIKDAVIGDRVEASVMKMKKSYGFARLARIVEASEYRVEPRCEVARKCGGCQMQELDYARQLVFKENKVCNNLQRIGGFANLVMVDADGLPRDGAGDRKDGIMDGDGEQDNNQDRDRILVYPIIGMDEPWRYRNKAQFPFGKNRDGEVITGFYAGRTHAIIEQDDCLIGVVENEAVLECIKGYMEEYGVAPYDENSHRGLVRHVLIRKGFKTGEMMVCLVLNGDVKKLDKADVLVERLVGLYEKESGCCVVSVSCSVNREKTNVIMGKEVVNMYGPGYITDYIGDVKYHISPLSFYQVNPVQTERLYGTALEYAGLTGNETVWDLYCGIGTISLFLARQAKKVYGVEIVPQAIDDARENAKLNGIRNVEFFVGKAEEVLPEQYEKNRVYADVIVVDPPRKGCDEVCLETIVKMRPERVVYVSCDSATLARDLKWLGERGYRVERVRGVDMFPHATHCEIIVEICRK